MKRFLVFEGPVKSRSGYGARTRDLIYSLKPFDEEFDIKVIPTSWGGLPDTALDEDTERNKWLLSKIQNIDINPDAYIKIGLPTEFSKRAPVNIGFTAGVETNYISSDWVQALNTRCDVSVVSSNYVKDVFQNSVYGKKNQQGNKVGELKVQTPVEVLFEGYDEDVFTGEYTGSETVESALKDIPETFCFLFTGHWLQGEFGHDRKDVAGMIQSFYRAFIGKKKQPALILKTGNTFTYRDRIDVQGKLKALKNYYSPEDQKKLPNIYLVWGELTDKEMNDLYNHKKVKVHVSFTKGEGFGRPLLEASTSGKLIMSTYCTGHKDFLENIVKIPTKLQQIHKSVVWNKVLIEESAWHYVNYDKAIKLFEEVYNDYHTLKTQALHQKRESSVFTLKNMGIKFKELLDKYVPVKKELVMPDIIDLDELEDMQ